MSQRHVRLRFSYRANKANKVEVISPEWNRLKLEYHKGIGNSKLFVKEVNVKYDKSESKSVAFQYAVDNHKLGIKDKWFEIKPYLRSPILFCNYERSQQQSVTLRFTIDYKTEFGEDLYIYGSIPEFGFWNPKYAYKMSYVNDNENYNWQAEIGFDCLPEILVYKYFVVFKDGNKRFESGSLRYIELSELLSNNPSKVIQFNDQWRNKSTFILNNADTSLISKLMTEKNNNVVNHAKLIFYLQYNIFKDREARHLSKNKYIISIVGSLKQLGEWKPEKSLHLYSCQSDLWIGSTDIDVSKDISFDYKLILNILDKNDKKRVHELYWQYGENLSFKSQLSANNKSLIFVLEIGRPHFNINTPVKIDDLPFYSNYKKMAEETVDILERKKYYLPDSKHTKIKIRDEIDYMIRETKTYKPDYRFTFDGMIMGMKRNDFCNVEVVDESSFASALRIQNELNIKDVCVLNFASAIKPGGGFLHGRQAQEESLSRSSMLYGSIKPQREMYDHHKRNKDPYYTDYMIYSPKVPVIRNDNGDLIPPYYVSVITSAAVNFNQIIIQYYDNKQFASNQIDLHDSINDLSSNSVDNNNNNNSSNHSDDDDIYNSEEFLNEKQKARDVMFTRCQKILELAIVQKNRAIVLGAFGCGVFKNDPQMISLIFKELLFGEGYEYAKFFDYVVFAIIKGKKDSSVFDIFKNTLAPNDEL